MKYKSLIIRIVITVLFALVSYYLSLPPMNFSSFSFYIYWLMVFVVFKLTGIVNINDTIKRYKRTGKLEIGTKRSRFYLYIAIGGVFIFILIINIIFSPLFMSSSYAKRIEVNENASFAEDIKEVDFKKLPLLDKDSSTKLGDRVMGQMPELVSQFSVSDLYTQINYNNDIVRVTPLEYADLIKYFTNRSDGVKGYITVNSVSGEAELVKLNKGMRYMPSAYFNENLYRKLRFSYPTKIFGKESFEIDNDGNPYWIVPTLKFTAVGLKREVSGAIILDPITGKSKYYKVKDVPSWVDHVYSSDLIIEQVNNWGSYKNGFFNSVFGQKGVVQTTDGYNYMIQDDDVYLYTGITSAAADESNVGFILTNLRTKQTNYYAVPGAEEYSAMESAKGQVQQMNYTSSFPLLINLNSRPTYLMSLKDNAGLVKMYAFVDVEDYQKVVVTDSSLGIEKAANNYINNVNFETLNDNKITKEIIIKTISSAVIDNNTHYYFTDENGQKYKVSVKTNEYLLPFIKIGSKIKVTFTKEKEIIEVIKVE